MLNGNINKLPEITTYRSDRMIYETDKVRLSEKGATITGYFLIKK